jgi:hypothetical protein
MNSVWLGIIRHALTALGGGLVTSGAISDSELQTAIGAVVTLIGLAASIISKRAADSQQLKGKY